VTKTATAFDTTLDAIARRLAAARGAAKLTFDQLARRSDVSKGSLVKLEQGHGNPSIGVLCQVAAALGISLADLVSGAAGGPEPVAFDPAGGKVLWKGPHGGFARLVAGTSGADMVELWEWKLKPTERHEAAAHSKGTRETIVVVSGKLGFSLGGWKTSIPAGRGLLATTDLAHAYWCEGSRPVRFQMFVTERPERR
jgi:transcriptional regulator with XRE-family HTH domain